MTLLEQMMRHVGKNDEADICREYAYGSKEAYHFHWVKDDKIDTKHMAELVRPIALGLLNDQEKKNVAEELALMVTHRNFKVGTGFLSTPFLLQTLAENGYLRTGYKMMEMKKPQAGWRWLLKERQQCGNNMSVTTMKADRKLIHLIIILQVLCVVFFLILYAAFELTVRTKFL
jgi:alpha-L-rhamnosidase